MRSHVRSARLVAFALVVSVLRLSLAAPARADFIVPTIVAQHAFVGDPLWGLDTVDGTVFGIAPDERTAMASTTKIMTLHLLNNAIAVGYVSPNDLVTVSALAASIGGSTMADTSIPAVPLQAGEIVSLDGLAHGMIYPSGNNAAWAIAEYVATAIYGAFPSSQDAVDRFVDLMNDHATSMGLVDTHFTSPNGFDDPFQAGVTPTPDELNHYTTARELAKMMAHAITDSYFQSVVGLQGTYTTTGTPPSGPVKTYSWGWGSNYPGWEGAKGGGTQNCNGPNQACVVTSASRLGRRVVIAEMQGDPTNEQAPLLDLGFATIFHPELLAETTDGPVLAQAVECLPDGRGLTAVITGANAMQLTTWSLPQAAGSIEKIASNPVRAQIGGSSGGGSGSGKSSPKSPNEADVDVLRLGSGHIITASRAGGSIRLGAWDIYGDGTPTALVAGVDVGSGRSVSLAPVAPNVFVTAVRANNNQLVIKSWRLSPTRTGDWTISLLDTELGGGFLADVHEVAAGGSGVATLFSGKSPVLVPVRKANGDASIGFYDVDPATGNIEQNVFIGGATTGSHFSVATMTTDAPDGELYAPQFFAVSLKDDDEHLLVKHYRVDPDGEATSAGSVQGSFNVLETAVTTFDHGGVVVTARDLADHDVLGVFEGRRTATDAISGDEVVKHVHGQGRAVDSCRAPTALADADVLMTAIVSGDLTLRLFQIGARPEPNR
jgi:serine-type D-Ala-D-Ala carboxypeptidase (penicillin-binding protein 5/6)